MRNRLVPKLMTLTFL